MKKIILLLIVFIAFAFSFTAKAQCIATTEFPEVATISINHGLPIKVRSNQLNKQVEKIQKLAIL